MEDVASGASWPEDLWFNEHHLDEEMTAQRFSQPMIAKKYVEYMLP